MKTRLISSITILQLLTASLLAEPLVSWHGRYLAEGIPAASLALAGGVDIENGIAFSYSEDSPISPRQSFYDQTAPGAVFYGVIQLVNHGKQGDMAEAMNHIRSKDAGASADENVILISTSPGKAGGGHQNAQGMLFWNEKSFTKGDPGGEGVGLGDITEFRVEASSRSDLSIRFAIRSGEQWYLSRAIFPEEGPAKLLAPVEERWQAWNPLEIPLADAGFGEEVAGDTLNHITAVGLYFSATCSTTNRATIAIKKFLVQ